MNANNMNHFSEIGEIYRSLFTKNANLKLNYDDVAEICYYKNCYDVDAIDWEAWNVYKTLEDACMDLANGGGYFNSPYYTKESAKLKKLMCSDILNALEYTILYVPDKEGGHYLISYEEEN